MKERGGSKSLIKMLKKGKKEKRKYKSLKEESTLSLLTEYDKYRTISMKISNILTVIFMIGLWEFGYKVLFWVFASILLLQTLVVLFDRISLYSELREELKRRKKEWELHNN